MQWPPTPALLARNHKVKRTVSFYRTGRSSPRCHCPIGNGKAGAGALAYLAALRAFAAVITFAGRLAGVLGAARSGLAAEMDAVTISAFGSSACSSLAMSAFVPASLASLLYDSPASLKVACVAALSV